jgi:hypothetical protein
VVETFRVAVGGVEGDQFRYYLFSVGAGVAGDLEPGCVEFPLVAGSFGPAWGFRVAEREARRREVVRLGYVDDRVAG